MADYPDRFAVRAALILPWLRCWSRRVGKDSELGLRFFGKGYSFPANGRISISPLTWERAWL